MSMPRLRPLPRYAPRWERDADVVVVGSGAAGLSAALAAAGRGRRVLLITKEDLGGGATPLAQGGLAAAIGPGDTAALHQRDTLVAGAGLCDPDAVCRFMKMITAEKLLRCLRDGVHEVQVASDVADRARRAVRAMIALGTPSAAGE